LQKPIGHPVRGWQKQNNQQWHDGFRRTQSTFKPCADTGGATASTHINYSTGLFSARSFRILVSAGQSFLFLNGFHAALFLRIHEEASSGTIERGY